MTKPTRLNIESVRVAYWLLVFATGALMWNTLHEVFRRELGWVGGAVLAAVIAIAVEVVFGKL
jgi:hypothetical protein